MSAKVSTFPFGTPPAKGSTCAGQLTVISASDVVSVGGCRYVTMALNTAVAGALVWLVEPGTKVPSFTKYSTSGVCACAQWPRKLNCFDCCPGGSRRAALKSATICVAIVFAVVCWLLACWVFNATGNRANNVSRQNAAIPRAKVTSTSENAAVSRTDRFMTSWLGNFKVFIVGRLLSHHQSRQTEQQQH